LQDSLYTVSPLLRLRSFYLVDLQYFRTSSLANWHMNYHLPPLILRLSWAPDHELTISWLLWREIDTSWPKVSDCLINNSSCPNLSSCLISHGCVCLLYTAWCLLVTCISMKYPLFMMTIDFIMSWDEYKLVL
jgi:hypothetical protein